ncbi:sensor histidine kinase [Gorillibacterium timonense]|uniref:sensor histidine kinase n=1 Tax=Gorillibacterium timonense TaxID=1689269 RepID=UPI00071C5307|nr:sensor histidine kinase [Gorillibacterium timonense]
MKPSINNVRLRGKMLLMYFLSVFLPIVLTNLYIYKATTDSVREQRMQDVQLALSQMKNEFEREVGDALDISSGFYTDHLLNEIIDTDYEHPADYIGAYDSYLRRILNSGSPVYNSVEGISLYVDNPTLLYSGGIYFIDEAVKQQEWYRTILKVDRSQPVIMRTGSDGRMDKLSIIRRMNYYYPQNEYEKFLKIDLRMSTIHKILGNLNVQGSIYLLNEAGEIEFTTDPNIDTTKGMIPYQTAAKEDRRLEFDTGAFYTNDQNEWKLVAKIPKDVVLRDSAQSQKLIVLLSCLNFLLPSLVIIWISRSMNARLVRILKHMKKVKNQHYETIKEPDYRDEIGQLTAEFNRMTLELRSLINDVYVADIQRANLELERRNAQLNALQSQINPHFLFNALETIRMRSLMKDEDETSHIIHNMAKLFRNSLVWKRDMVTVQEEMEFVHCFLEIQKYRFGDKINYRVQADADTLEEVIPKMAIVTFVENASIHGIEKRKAGGCIEVTIGVRNEGLVCTVKDNGVGMAAEQVERIHRYLQTEDEMGERIGIQNVVYRLKLFYGDRFKLAVESRPNEGTRVDLFIPRQDL